MKRTECNLASQPTKLLAVEIRTTRWIILIRFQTKVHSELHIICQQKDKKVFLLSDHFRFDVWQRSFLLSEKEATDFSGTVDHGESTSFHIFLTMFSLQEKKWDDFSNNCGKDEKAILIDLMMKWVY